MEITAEILQVIKPLLMLLAILLCFKAMIFVLDRL